MIQVSCSEASTYEDVYLMIGGYWIQISASDYILNFSGTCILAFVPIDATYWLAGLPLLSGYYTVHDNIDPTKARMGFAPHVTSNKVNVATAFTPSNSVEKNRWELTFLFDIY